MSRYSELLATVKLNFKHVLFSTSSTKGQMSYGKDADGTLIWVHRCFYAAEMQSVRHAHIPSGLTSKDDI